MSVQCEISMKESVSESGSAGLPLKYRVIRGPASVRLVELGTGCGERSGTRKIARLSAACLESSLGNGVWCSSTNNSSYHTCVNWQKLVETLRACCHSCRHLYTLRCACLPLFSVPVFCEHTGFRWQCRCPICPSCLQVSFHDKVHNSSQLPWAFS
jgi:hypothetical protein